MDLEWIYLFLSILMIHEKDTCGLLGRLSTLLLRVAIPICENVMFMK